MVRILNVTRRDEVEEDKIMTTKRLILPRSFFQLIFSRQH